MAKQSAVGANRAHRPDLPVSATFSPNRSVQGSIGVRQDREGEIEKAAVGGEPGRVAEGDYGNCGVPEKVDVVADRDHVFLARKSSKVSVQHKHKWAAPMVADEPRSAVGVEEFYIRKKVTNGEWSGRVHDGSICAL